MSDKLEFRIIYTLKYKQTDDKPLLRHPALDQLYYTYLDDQGEPRSGEDCKAFLLNPLLFCRGYVFAEKQYKKKQAIQLSKFNTCCDIKSRRFKFNHVLSEDINEEFDMWATGRVNREEISFITLSEGGRQAYEIRDASEGIEMAETITENLKKLADKFDKGNLHPEAIFSENWVRITQVIPNPKSKAGIQINPDGQYLIALNWFTEVIKKINISKQDKKKYSLEMTIDTAFRYTDWSAPRSDDFIVYNVMKGK